MNLHRNCLRSLAAATLVALAGPACAEPADGVLDPTFGTEGITMVAFDTAPSNPLDVALDAVVDSFGRTYRGLTQVRGIQVVDENGAPPPAPFWYARTVDVTGGACWWEQPALPARPGRRDQGLTIWRSSFTLSPSEARTDVSCCSSFSMAGCRRTAASSSASWPGV